MQVMLGSCPHLPGRLYHLPIVACYRGPSAPVVCQSKQELGLTVPASSSSWPYNWGYRTGILPTQPPSGRLPEETEKGWPGSCLDRCTVGVEGPRWCSMSGKWSSQARSKLHLQRCADSFIQSCHAHEAPNSSVEPMREVWICADFLKHAYYKCVSFSNIFFVM